jgi:hypothetical protein
LLSSFFALFFFFTLGGLAVDELIDQVFQHGGRLCAGNLVTVSQVNGVAARFNADVLLALQAGSENFQGAIFWKFIARFEFQGYQRLEGLVIKLDIADAAYNNTGALDGRLRLEAADIVELAGDRVGIGEGQGAHIARLEGEEQQCGQSQQDKHSNPDVDRFTMHFYFLTLVIRRDGSAGFRFL